MGLSKAKKIASLFNALFKTKILRKKIPLIVGWGITERCNKKCLYCSLWHGRIGELPTDDIFKIVDALAQLGTIRISFTGGEPLMREDMGRIINYVHNKGIEVRLNSNGALVKEKISDLRNLDILNLSFEGEKQAHDIIRGKGSYEEVFEAAKIAKEHGIRVIFNTTLTNVNFNSVDFVLNKVDRLGSKVNFQPAIEFVLGDKVSNPIALEKGKYQKVIKELINKKIKGNRVIGNSLPALEYLYNWPDGIKKVKCTSGWISCRIEPDGSVFHCSRKKNLAQPVNARNEKFWKEFIDLEPVSCDDCWCNGRLELSFAFFGGFKIAFNQIRSFLRSS